MKVSVVYWTQSGNTEEMANAVAEGARKGGAEAELLHVSEASDKILQSDVILFGCPAMGNEELDEGEFEPFFASVEPFLQGKKIGLFGSYGWGNGEWMETWQERVKQDGAILIADGVKANYEPDEIALAACRALGRAAAE